MCDRASDVGELGLACRAQSAHSYKEASKEERKKKEENIHTTRLKIFPLAFCLCLWTGVAKVDLEKSANKGVARKTSGDAAHAESTCVTIWPIWSLGSLFRLNQDSAGTAGKDPDWSVLGQTDWTLTQVESIDLCVSFSNTIRIIRKHMKQFNLILVVFFLFFLPIISSLFSFFPH